MGENHFSALPTAFYGVILLLAGVAYWILAHRIIAIEGPNSTLAKAIGKDWKGICSVVIYAFAIPIAFYNTWIAQAIYYGVALIWVIPDKRIERILSE